MWLLGTDRACDLLKNASFTQVRQIKWHRDNDAISHTTCLLTASFLALRYVFSEGSINANDFKSTLLFAICSIFLGLASYMITK